MKVSVIKTIVSALITGVCILPVMTFAQVNENDEKLLQKKWILENVSAFEENVQKLPFSLDSLDNAMSCYEVPSEMDIRQDEIVFVRKNGTDKARYDLVVNGNGMCIPICAQWKIVGKKLQLQWTQDIEGKEPKVLTIVLTYKLK